MHRFTSPMGGRQDIPSDCTRDYRLALVGKQAYAGVCLDLAQEPMALHRLSKVMFGVVERMDCGDFIGTCIGQQPT